MSRSRHTWDEVGPSQQNLVLFSGVRIGTSWFLFGFVKICDRPWRFRSLSPSMLWVEPMTVNFQFRF